jgi:hypothetical protein
MTTLSYSMRSASRPGPISQRGFLLLAWTLVLFTAAIGCRNANTATQARPTASPTPAAEAQKPAQTPTPSAQAEAVPAAPIQVKPPASFTPDQLPQNQSVHFTVAGSAGQFLLVKVKLGVGDPRESVWVQPPGSTSGPLDALQKGGDCSGDFIYALPQPGIYQVEFDSAGREATINFSLLAADDPMVDTGIKPEEISIDFGSFAQRDRIAPVPYAVGCDEGDEPWPMHLALDNGHFEFRIMQVSGYRKVFETDPDGGRAMTNLEAALRPGGKAIANNKLPYEYKDRWGAHIMSARYEFLKGEGWRGLRWVSGQGGDEDYPSLGLGYMFEGLSNDGRYFILIRADISHPDQKRLRPPSQINGTPPKTWESPGPHGKEARLQLEKALAAADPASFQPSLAELDAVIRSLRLK